MALIFKNALKRIIHNKKIYILLLFQLMLGVLFISYSLNHVISADQKMDDLFAHNSSSELTMIAKPPRKNEDTKGFYLTYTEYEQVYMVSGKKVSYSSYSPQVAFYEDEAIDFGYLYSNEIMPEADCVYIGEGLLQQIRKENVSFLDNSLMLDQDILRVSGLRDREYRVCNMPDKYESTRLLLDAYGKEIDVKRCIVFPFENLDDLTKTDLILSRLNLYIDDTKTDQEKMGKVIDALGSTHNIGYTYSFRSVLIETEDVLNHVTSIPLYLGKMAIIMVIIVVLGMTGVMRLFLKKREKELAIRLAVGAKRLRVSIEFVAEVFIACVTAWGVGSTCSALLLHYAAFDDYVRVDYHLCTLFITFALIVLITFLVSIISIWKIYLIKPYEIIISTT
ncbi:hypothetical protein LJC51_06095 [Lachnospiraceae bacterium OttesenSCG-928-J05]|nr:hypothetical protein [Lachnospiraceae bacterium OttesenSCG-928-J05]